RPDRPIANELGATGPDCTDLDCDPIVGGDRPKIRSVTRAVFHSRFAGHEKDSVLRRYWEETPAVPFSSKQYRFMSTRPKHFCGYFQIQLPVYLCRMESE